MATTYTQNYGLGKQEDHSDKFDMSVITANADIIDRELKSQQNQLNTKSDAGDIAALQAQINQIEISASAEAVVAPEVAGARVSENGTEYTTLKERLDTENETVTSNIVETDNKIESVSSVLNESFDTESVNLESTFSDSKYINSQGDIVTTSQYSTYGVTNYIDVSDYGSLEITCMSGFNNGFYAFYDESYNYVLGDFAGPGSGQTYSGQIIVPTTAKYIVLSGTVEILPTIAAISKFVVPGLDDIAEISTTISEKVPGYNILNLAETVEGYMGEDGNVIPNTGSLDWMSTGFISVYDIKDIAASQKDDSSRSALPIHFIVEYDAHKDIIKYTQLGSNAGLFTLSDQTAYFRLSYHITDTEEPMIAFGVNISAAYQPYSVDIKISGEALPEDVKKELNIVSDNTAPIYSVIDDIVITPKKLITSAHNAVADYDDERYTIATYEIPEGTAQLGVTASANYGNLFYIFTDENNNTLVTSERAESGAGITKITKELVTVPASSKYFIVANVISPVTPSQTIYSVTDGIKASSISENLRSEINEMITEESAPKHYWEGKKWVCVGDSLTEVNSRTTKHYHDYIAESTGITVINMGVSGTGYKREEGNNNAFYQRIVNVPTDADVVTIFGSGNDLALISDLGTPSDTGTETICGCINTTIDNLIALIPAVSLGIVAPTPWINNQPTLDDSNSMARYTEALREICKIRSIPFLDLYHCSNLRPWTAEGRAACYSKDDGNGVHPDEAGHKLIAPRFKNFLESLIM